MMCGDPAQQLAQQGAASAAAGDQPAPEDMPASQSAESIARQVRPVLLLPCAQKRVLVALSIAAVPQLPVTLYLHVGV